MDEPIRQIIYRSIASLAVNDRLLLDIASAASRNNPHHRVSGFLLFRSGLFVQYLEGPPSRVAYLLDRVERDRRHHDIVRLADLMSESRLVGSWHMMVMNLEKCAQFTDDMSSPLCPMLKSILAMPKLRREEHAPLFDRVLRLYDELDARAFDHGRPAA